MILPDRCPKCKSKNTELGGLDLTGKGFWVTCKECKYVFRWVGTK